jgi:hypothetical protein
MWHSLSSILVFSLCAEVVWAQDFSVERIVGLSGRTTGPIVGKDFDLDGDADLVKYQTGSPGQIQLLESLGSSGFALPVVLGHFEPRTLLAADFNQDGIDDIGFSDSQGVHYFPGMGALSFGARIRYFDWTGLPTPPTRFAIGDFEGDGDLDVALSFPVPGLAGIVDVYESVGGASFLVQSSWSYSNVVDDIWLEDMDSNGLLDLFVQTQDPGMLVHPYSSGVGFEDSRQVGIDLVRPLALSVVQFDADPNMEILVVDEGKMKISEFDSVLGFSSFAVLAERVNINISLADIDLDGDLDIVNTGASSDTTEHVRWFPNDGSGGLGLAQSLSLDARGATSAAVADFDGDGDMDISTVAEWVDTAYLLENLGPGPQVSLTGSCPGQLSGVITSGTGQYAVLYGSRGAFRSAAAGPCPSETVSINPPVGVALVGSTFSVAIPFAGACGTVIQVVDLSSCQKSLVLGLD